MLLIRKRRGIKHKISFLSRRYRTKKLYLVDMAPTVAYMLGVRMPKQCEGAVAYRTDSPKNEHKEADDNGVHQN